MYSIIPLAGPDFFIKKLNTIKPYIKIDGEFLIKKALTSRWWYTTGELSSDKCIFVLKDTQHTSDFIKYLKKNFKNCKTIVVDHYTKGALLSSLAGAALITDFHETICVDLIDILYTIDFKQKYIRDFFKKNPEYYGIIPCFQSNYEKYSYLVLKDNEVLQTMEKKRISTIASAGTYFFKDLTTFMEAATGSIRFNKVYDYNNNLFLCPSYNEIIRLNKKVFPLMVKNIECISSYVKNLEESQNY